MFGFNKEERKRIVKAVRHVEGDRLTPPSLPVPFVPISHAGSHNVTVEVIGDKDSYGFYPAKVVYRNLEFQNTPQWFYMLDNVSLADCMAYTVDDGQSLEKRRYDGKVTGRLGYGEKEWLAAVEVDAGGGCCGEQVDWASYNTRVPLAVAPSTVLNRSYLFVGSGWTAFKDYRIEIPASEGMVDVCAYFNAIVETPIPTVAQLGAGEVFFRLMGAIALVNPDLTVGGLITGNGPYPDNNWKLITGQITSDGVFGDFAGYPGSLELLFHGTCVVPRTVDVGLIKQSYNYDPVILAPAFVYQQGLFVPPGWFAYATMLFSTRMEYRRACCLSNPADIFAESPPPPPPPPPVITTLPCTLSVTNVATSPASPYEAGATVTFTATVSGTYTSISWATSDGQSGTSNPQNFTFSSAGTFKVTVVVTDANNCTSSGTVVVIINPSKTTTTSGTVPDGVTLVKIDATSGTQTQTLPDPATWDPKGEGKTLLFYKVAGADANAARVSPGTRLLDGSSSFTTVGNTGSSKAFRTDGTNWYTISSVSALP